jgi:hypothetical protein
MRWRRKPPSLRKWACRPLPTCQAEREQTETRDSTDRLARRRQFPA